MLGAPMRDKGSVLDSVVYPTCQVQGNSSELRFDLRRTVPMEAPLRLPRHDSTIAQRCLSICPRRFISGVEVAFLAEEFGGKSLHEPTAGRA